MRFTFEALQDLNLLTGSSYFMDFGNETTEDAILSEGKLLTVFGEPAFKSDNYENAFDYVIRATDETGKSVILSVYSVGLVHIGASQKDDFAKEAAEALIAYVSAAEPSDFTHTVHYLDFGMRLDISLQNQKISVEETELSEEEVEAIFAKWFSA